MEQKTLDKHGYFALVLGGRHVRVKKVKRPQQGLFAKNDLLPNKFLKEFRVGLASLIPGHSGLLAANWYYAKLQTLQRWTKSGHSRHQVPVS